MKLIFPMLLLLVTLPVSSVAQTSNFVFLDCDLKLGNKLERGAPPKLSIKIDLSRKIIYEFRGIDYKNMCTGTKVCAVDDDAFVISGTDGIPNKQIILRISISRYSGEIYGRATNYEIDTNNGARRLSSVETLFTGVCKKGIDLAPRKF